MQTLVTIAEAASYLGVSKATLRNWDREGKLKAYRHPINRYRAYDLEDLRALRVQTSLIDDTAPEATEVSETSIADSRSVKRVVARLHAVFRDTDGDSSIIQRFDEITKLLFLKLLAERDDHALFSSASSESRAEYVERIRSTYEEHARRYSRVIPERFSRLNCSDDAIIRAGTVLSTLSFAGANFDVKGVTYEEVIRGTFDKSDHQQFFTPPQIISFMVAMLRPFLKGTIADPACGTAGFLAEVAKSGVGYQGLLGLEIDERLSWVSGINLLLHGAVDFEVRAFGNSGTLGPNAVKYFDTIDVILTNPPFGSDLTDTTLLQGFELGRGRLSRRRGILFIERCWALLKEDGVLGIVIDEGVLNLPSTSDVRQFITERFDILSIISLPESAFMPYANVNASILFLRKTSAKPTSSSVFFGKADNVGRKLNGDDDFVYDASGQAVLNSDLPSILQLWEAFQAGRCIEDNELTFIADVGANLTEDASTRIDFRYHHPSRNRSRDLLAHSKHELYTLADLCEERNETVIPSQEMADQVILYTGLANIEGGKGVAHQVPTPAASLKSAVKRYEPDDIVFARMRPNLRKVALMDFPEGGYVSPECSVFSVRRAADGNYIVEPEILAAVLRSDLVFGQIMHLIAGIGRPRLSIKDLRKVRIPVPPLATQEAGKAEFQGRTASAKQLLEKARVLQREAYELELKAINELANRLIGYQQ